jgi:hypothetical protein
MGYSALLLLLALSAALKTRDDGLCDGNRFVFLSTYVLGLQTELKLTFAEINDTLKVDEVFYQEDLFKSYRIYNIRQNITYN